MDEKQILLVKVSWSSIYKRPELVEEAFVRHLKNVCPQMNHLKKAKIFTGISELVNTLVLNIHTFQNVFAELDEHVRMFEEQGCDRQSFNNMVLAFLLTLEKIQGSAWNIEIKSAWVMAIATLSYKYSETREKVISSKSVLA